MSGLSSRAGLASSDLSSKGRLPRQITSSGLASTTASHTAPAVCSPAQALPIPGRGGGYVVQLSVFHQLHCLVGLPPQDNPARRIKKLTPMTTAQNLIRKGIYGAVDMTDKDDLLGIEHLDHCLDMLRQSIMVRHCRLLRWRTGA